MPTGVIFEESLRLDKSIKIIINYLLGPAFLIWLSWDVYHVVTAQEDIGQQWQSLVDTIAKKGILPLAAVVLLMFLQWLLEAFKWKLLLKDIIQLHWTAAFGSILSGISVSVVTPNRLGEFAGRIIHLPNGTRLEGTAFTFMGNLAQMIITCLLGSLGLCLGYDILKSQLHSPESVYSIDLLLILAPIASVILLLVYFSSSWMLEKLGHWRLLRAFANHLLVLSHTSSGRLTWVMLISFLRYLIFIAQYLIVFYYCGFSSDPLPLMIGVAVMLLWLSIVPTFSFMEMGVRWQFALLLFPAVGTSLLAIPLSVTIIWLVNFILPAILGAFYFLRKPSSQITGADI